MTEQEQPVAAGKPWLPCLACGSLAAPLLPRPACGIFQMAAQDTGMSCMEHTPTDSEGAARLICW